MGKPCPLLVRSICAAVLKGDWMCRIPESKIGSHITSSVTNGVLRHLSGAGPSLPWKFFKWVESVPGYRHSLESHWTMVQVLTKTKHFKQARSLLESIANKNFLPTPSVLKALLASRVDRQENSQILSWLVAFYAKSNAIHDSLGVFDQMRENELTPDPPACAVLLKALSRERLTSTVWTVYGRMLDAGVPANLYISNVLIRACCNSGDTERADRVLSEMESNSIAPNLFTYNTLIYLYSSRGMHYEASCVQKRMEAAGVSPDIVTYNSLLHGYCKEGRTREALRIFSEMSRPANHITYTTLIDGHCRANEIDEAIRLCRAMEGPNTITYNTLIRTLCGGGRIRDANVLLREMAGRGVAADTATCNTLINAYGKAGDMASALKVRDRLAESGLSADRFTYKALVRGFCKAREPDGAREHLFGMLDAGFSPCYATYSWIVDVYCDLGMEEAATVGLVEEIADRGRQCGGTPVHRAFIRRLCRRERLSSALVTLDLMRRRGLRADGVVYTALAYALFRTGDTVQATEMLGAMTRSSILVTLPMYRSLAASYSADSKVLDSFWHLTADRGLLSNRLRVRVLAHRTSVKP